VKLRIGLFVLSTAAATAWAQSPPPPTGLTVKSATSAQTQLTWSGTASSYTVQRALVGAAFVNIATVTTTSYTDTTLDPYNQTVYQVIAGTTATAVSNQVMVGPPPSGLSLAAAAPASGVDVNITYGQNVSLAFDGNGDPAFAFIFGDPNNDGNAPEGQLWFRSWNRAQVQWNPLVKVATPGNVTSPYEAVVALAYDISASTFALASQDLAGNLDLYVSTNGGAAWTLKTTFTSASGIDGPALALASGNIYLAYQAGGSDGLQYVTGKLSAAASTWSTKAVPAIPNVGAALPGKSPALALDNSGNPAIAFWAPDTTQSYNAILFFWRPAGSSAPVAVASTNNTQSDTVGVRMTFYQANPRIVFNALTSDAEANNDSEVHFVRSDDGGKTWQKPVLIPPDGNESTNYPLDVAIDSSGNGALAYESNEAAGDGSQKCDSPKLALSSDLTNWSVCQVAPDLGTFNGNPGAIQIAFGGNNRRWVVWQSNGDSVSNSGVVMYREPPPNQPAGPAVSNILDAESSRATIVPGEWVALYGANFAGATRTWNGADFTAAGNGNLPVNVAGVTVQFAGLPAAVYFVSPTQLDVQAPMGISGTVPVVVSNNGTPGTAFNVSVVQNAPSLFYYPAGTNLYPAAVHIDGTLIGDPAVTPSATKAKAGETIILFVNGLAPSPSGVIIGGAIAYAGPVTVTIGTTAVTPAFTGLVAAGEYQINVVVPSSLKTGSYPITVATQGQTSPSNITLPIQ